MALLKPVIIKFFRFFPGMCLGMPSHAHGQRVFQPALAAPLEP